jgi:hypothetical protein
MATCAQILSTSTTTPARVVLEEHTNSDDSTLDSRTAPKFAKYRPAVAAFKAAHPALADYDCAISVFAVGHAGTVAACTVKAILNIPMPPDAAAVLIRAVVAAVSRHNGEQTKGEPRQEAESRATTTLELGPPEASPLQTMCSRFSRRVIRSLAARARPGHLAMQRQSTLDSDAHLAKSFLDTITRLSSS